MKIGKLLMHGAWLHGLILGWAILTCACGGDAATGKQGGMVTPGGALLAADTPPSVVAVVWELHERRAPATGRLRRLGPEAAPAMTALLQSPSPEEALGGLAWHSAHGQRIASPGVEELAGHRHVAVRRELAKVLRSTGVSDDREALLRLLEDPEAGVRLNAVEALRRIASTDTCVKLLDTMNDSEEQVALLAGRAVADVCGASAEGALLRMAGGGEDGFATFSALWALRRRDVKVPMDTVLGALASPASGVAQEGLKALALHGAEGRRLLELHSESPHWEWRRTSMEVLARYFPEGAGPVAERALGDDAAGVRAAAVTVLATQLGPSLAVDLLRQHLDDPHPEVRAAAVTVLGLLGTPAALGALAASWRDESDPEVGRLLVLNLGQRHSPRGLGSLVEMLESRRDPWAFRARHRLTCLAGGDQGDAGAWKRWVSSLPPEGALRPESAAESR